MREGGKKENIYFTDLQFISIFIDISLGRVFRKMNKGPLWPFIHYLELNNPKSARKKGIVFLYVAGKGD